MSESANTSAEPRLVTIKITGSFDFTARQRFVTAMQQHASGEACFVLDLSGVTSVDVSALSLLLQLRAHNCPQHKVVLRGVAETVQSAIQDAGLAKLFEIET